jgi:formylglycine-generating enzyme required for sulfatase activity
MGRSLDGNDRSASSEILTRYTTEVPEHCATVGPFYLDTFEVTVGRFLAFLQHYDSWRAAGFPMEGQGANLDVKPDPVTQTGWHSQYTSNLSALTDLRHGLACSPSSLLQTWPNQGDPDDEHLSLPITCVVWWEAFAFCLWDGGHLPTEAEWEFAAAGGAENRLYPWGNQAPDCSLAGFGDCAIPARYRPVGSLAGVGRFGQLDLAGSAAEWVLDRYASYADEKGVAHSCDHCVNDGAVGFHVIRGGSQQDPGLALRSVFRYPLFDAIRDASMGFRCAR